MANVLSEKLRKRASRLGLSTSDRNTMVDYRSRDGIYFRFDAAGMSTEAFVERFAARLIEETERQAHSGAVEGLRRLLDVPTTADVENAVERLEDRMRDRS